MKNIHILSKLIILLAGFGLCAQETITGTIVDDVNQPIAGATITLKGPQGTYGKLTENDGRFELSVPQGKYNLEIRYLGFRSYQAGLEVSSAVHIGTITLQEGTEQLQSVEVIGRARTDYNSDYSFSATKVAINNKELPQAITTVTKELMTDRLAFQLPDAVKTVSNVTTTGLYNHYNIRGITQGDDGR